MNARKHQKIHFFTSARSERVHLRISRRVPERSGPLHAIQVALPDCVAAVVAARRDRVVLLCAAVVGLALRMKCVINMKYLNRLLSCEILSCSHPKNFTVYLLLCFLTHHHGVGQLVAEALTKKAALVILRGVDVGLVERSGGDSREPKHRAVQAEVVVDAASHAKELHFVCVCVAC